VGLVGLSAFSGSVLRIAFQLIGSLSLFMRCECVRAYIDCEINVLSIGQIVTERHWQNAVSASQVSEFSCPVCIVLDCEFHSGILAPPPPHASPLSRGSVGRHRTRRVTHRLFPHLCPLKAVNKGWQHHRGRSCRGCEKLAAIVMW
jgi:hypothetical protein